MARDPLSRQLRRIKREVSRFEELLVVDCVPDQTMKRLDKAVMLVKVGLKIGKNSLRVRI